jgi:hypothetical protein
VIPAFYRGLIFALADPAAATGLCQKLEAAEETTMNDQDLQTLRERIRQRCEEDLAAVNRFADLLKLNPYQPAAQVLQPAPNLPAAPTPRNDRPRRLIPAKPRGAQTTRPASPSAGLPNGKRGDRTRALRLLIARQQGEFTDRQLFAQLPDGMPAFRDAIDLHWLQTALFREKKTGLIEFVGSSREHGQSYRRAKGKEEQWAELRASFQIPTTAA